MLLNNESNVYDPKLNFSAFGKNVTSHKSLLIRRSAAAGVFRYNDERAFQSVNLKSAQYDTTRKLRNLAG